MFSASDVLAYVRTVMQEAIAADPKISDKDMQAARNEFIKQISRRS